jgi:hypothetical protein
VSVSVGIVVLLEFLKLIAMWLYAPASNEVANSDELASRYSAGFKTEKE